MLPARRTVEVPIEAGSPDDLFETGVAGFPDRGRVLKAATARHAVDAVRRSIHSTDALLELRIDGLPLGATEQASVRAEIRAYFEVEASRARDDRHLNRVEGRRALLTGTVASALALAIALPLRW
ncbi:MAG: hypothetical protein ACREBT_04735 [Thermoplasmata archaeon]